MIMPNWCINSFDVSHKDPEMIQRFVTSLKEGKLFEEFVPMPKALRETTAPSESNGVLMEKYGHSDWYSWAIENWGTKWDVEGESDTNADGLSTHGWFDTAWAPPISFWEALAEQGFNIDATFDESGVGFCGRWSNDLGEEYYEYDYSNPNWKNDIPEDVIDDFCLEENYQYWLEDNEPEESTS